MVLWCEVLGARWSIEPPAHVWAGFAIECAAANYYYGVALYQQLKENQDVFEDSDIDKKLEASQGESGSKAEDGPKEGNAEEVNDDLSIAWEALEVAKQSYIKDGMEKHKGALAGGHCSDI